MQLGTPAFKKRTFKLFCFVSCAAVVSQLKIQQVNLVTCYVNSYITLYLLFMFPIL